MHGRLEAGLLHIVRDANQLDRITAIILFISEHEPSSAPALAPMIFAKTQ
jgi:hypothetical protein